MTEYRILVVDDEEIALNNLVHILKGEGYRVSRALGGRQGMQQLQQQRFDLVVSDLRMPEVDGLQILQASRDKAPLCPVLMISGHATVDSAVEAMRLGAFHYLTKPFRIEEVRQLVAEALELHHLRQENLRLRSLLKKEQGTSFLTQDNETQQMLETARLAARSEANIVISGESGTGKELLAHFIHEHSPRHDGPFVAVNCGAFSEDLLSNELFGHAKGAYTGAGEARAGLIEHAHGGTLFLDEFTEMSPAMQVKLLRVIQEGELRRLGETASIQVDVRYLAASNRDLTQSINSGMLRQDLFFRLNVLQLQIKPLRERRGDIPLLAHHFLRQHALKMGDTEMEISTAAIRALSAHSYPGNVRELANLIERGIALSDGRRLDLPQLPESLSQQSASEFHPQWASLPTLEQQEQAYIQWVLEQTEGNRTRAAEILGIDRVSLWRKLKKREA